MYSLTGVLAPYFCSCLQKSCCTQKSGKVCPSGNGVISAVVVLVIIVERSLHKEVVSKCTVLHLTRLTDESHGVEFSRFKVLESSFSRS
jgi:hypothetical protein